jgi:hypothetical protein
MTWPVALKDKHKHAISVNTDLLTSALPDGELTR